MRRTLPLPSALIGFPSAEPLCERATESALMLTRLNKSRRLKAGWCIALAYLFCVLAPSLSFAFADGTRSAPCIIEDHGPGMHMHESAEGLSLHEADAAHDHRHGSSM